MFPLSTSKPHSSERKTRFGPLPIWIWSYGCQLYDLDPKKVSKFQLCLCYTSCDEMIKNSLDKVGLIGYRIPLYPYAWCVYVSEVSKRLYLFHTIHFEEHLVHYCIASREERIKISKFMMLRNIIKKIMNSFHPVNKLRWWRYCLLSRPRHVSLSLATAT